jgi:hypothetical protein
MPLGPTDTQWTTNSLAFMDVVGKKEDNGWEVVEKFYSARLLHINPAPC